MFKSIILCFAIFTLVSCNNDEAKDLELLTSKISLKITETCFENEDKAPVINLEILTEDIYNCFNYKIVTQSSNIGGIFQIQILGIEIGDICLTALGPATTSLVIDKEIQKIVLTNNDHSDEYTISFSASTIKIISVISNFSSFENSEYLTTC